MQCRSSSISCMDCHKDFVGNDYQGHTKCISEQEKYGGPGYKPAENQNKGEKKQMAWYETVQANLKKAGNTLRPTARTLLQYLTKHENVPRKKPKFFNFVKNVGRNTFDQDTVLVVWDLLESQWKMENPKPQEQNKTAEVATVTQEAVPEENSVSDLSHEKKKKKKDKKSKNEDLEGLLNPEEETSVMVENEVAVSKKEKKKRKRDEAEDRANATEEPLPDTGNSEEPPKKKKKKKNKNKDGDSNGVHEQGQSNGNGNVQNETETAGTYANGHAEDGDGELIMAAEDEDAPKKSKKKKKKKNKHEESTDGTECNGKYALLQQSMTEDDNSMIVEDSAAKKKKKKKNKHEILEEMQ